MNSLRFNTTSAVALYPCISEIYLAERRKKEEAHQKLATGLETLGHKGNRLSDFSFYSPSLG